MYNEDMYNEEMDQLKHIVKIQSKYKEIERDLAKIGKENLSDTVLAPLHYNLKYIEYIRKAIQLLIDIMVNGKEEYILDRELNRVERIKDIEDVLYELRSRLITESEEYINSGAIEEEINNYNNKSNY